MGDSIENSGGNRFHEEIANSTVILKKKHVVIDLLNLEGDSESD